MPTYASSDSVPKTAMIDNLKTPGRKQPLDHGTAPVAPSAVAKKPRRPDRVFPLLLRYRRV